MAETTNRDETPMQAAERTAKAISHFVAAVAYRASHGPLGEVPAEELDAFNVMRDALHELASHEYDRGFRRAVAMRKENRVPATPTSGTETPEEGKHG